MRGRIVLCMESHHAITYYQQLAAEFCVELEGVADLIPHLEAAHVSTARFVRSHQNVSLEFLAMAVAAVEQSAELQGVRKLDVTAARDTLQFLEEFRPVLDRIRALAGSLEFTMKSRRASLTADALQIYAIAKAVARDRDVPRSPRSSMISNVISVAAAL
jgi:hypothetical protein